MKRHPDVQDAFFTISAVDPTTAVYACRPVSADDSAHAEVAEEPVCSRLVDALAAARSAVQAVVAEPVRSAAMARIRYVAADDSSPVVADSVPDDSPAEHSAAPSKDALAARAAPLADSCPDGCRPAARYSAPAGSAVRKVAVRCAPAALQDGSRDGYSEPVGSAVDDSPDWADSVLADLAQVDSPQADLAQVDSPQADSVAVDWAAVDWAAACCSADLIPADYWAALTADDRSLLVARTDGWLLAADDFPADSVAADSPADWVVDDCQVDSVLADCSACRDSSAPAVPQVGSSQGAHSQADFPASYSADYPDDSWLQAMALASPGEQSLLAARMQEDSPHASAAFVGAPWALPDFVAAPAVSRRTMVLLVVVYSLQSQDGSPRSLAARRLD